MGPLEWAVEGPFRPPNEHLLAVCLWLHDGGPSTSLRQVWERAPEMTIALLDADILAYRAALGTEEVYDWNDGNGKVRIGDTRAAAKAAIVLADEWIQKANADDAILALTGPNKFRTRVLSTYNSNRKGSEKPVAHAAAVESLKEKFRFHLIPDLEADDILGVLMTTPRYQDNAVIVSLDKDLQTIPGRLLNPNKDRKPRIITEAMANHFWMSQVLTGDTVDGYSGLPGVGPVKAATILGAIGNGLGGLWSAVVKAYQSKGLTEADAIVQARMARILRREDYDKTTKTVRLWHPTAPVRIPVEDPNAQTE